MSNALLPLLKIHINYIARSTKYYFGEKKKLCSIELILVQCVVHTARSQVFIKQNYKIVLFCVLNKTLKLYFRRGTSMCVHLHHQLYALQDHMGYGENAPKINLSTSILAAILPVKNGGSSIGILGR
jgi:hypothetical protein